LNCFELNNEINIYSLLKKLDVSEAGIQILANKSCMLYMYIKDLRTPGANILKQDALCVGADVAVPKGVICCETSHVNALVMGTKAQFKALAKKLKAQPFGLKNLALNLEAIASKASLNKPKIMGVVNANEDSFFSKSRFQDGRAIEKIEKMIEDGAQMIDLGGVSSRPGSLPVSSDEELERVKPVIDAIYQQKLYEKATFSLDSYDPHCIHYALEKGFGFINDITGLRDDNVAKLAAQFGVPVCIMHMQGSPQSMQKNPHYEDVLESVDEFFVMQLEKAKSYGIKKVVLDVGIGFGKSLEHNLLLLKHHRHFLRHGCELLIGASRKSMINAITPAQIDERLPGTLAIHFEAVREGATIIRAHDVREHFQALEVYWAIKNTCFQGCEIE
jgi:dihydropteroate synthase